MLPLAPVDRATSPPELGLPRSRPTVAAAVLGGTVRRLDLLRNDGGSVTLDGALIGGADAEGRPMPWRGRVEVDDAVLTDGDEPVLACAVGNADGYATLDGLPLLTAPDPADGRARGRDRGPGRDAVTVARQAGTGGGAPGPRPGGRGAPLATVSCRSSTTGWPAG